MSFNSSGFERSIANSKGDKITPCGASEKNLNCSENVEPIHTFNVLFDKKSYNHRNILPLILLFNKLYKIFTCELESNALFMPKNNY